MQWLRATRFRWLARPLLALAATLLAMLLMRGDEFDPAVEHLKQVISIEPRHLAAHFNLGLIYRQSGQNELARQTFQAILQHHPQNQDAAKMLRELDRGR